MDSSAARVSGRAAPRGSADPPENRVAERALALARVLLSVAALFVAHFIPPDPSGEVEILLLVYAAMAVVFLLVLFGTTAIHPRLPLATHALDLLFAGALTFFPNGLRAPFFGFMLFPLFAAGFRWGFAEVMLTTGLIAGAMGVEIVRDPTPVMSTFVSRLIAIGAAGAAIGYLAEQQRRRRFEDRAISLVLGQARLVGTLAETVHTMLASVRSAFRAKHVLLVLQEQPSGRVLLWKADGSGGDPDTDASPDQLPASRRNDYIFDGPGAAWHAAMRPLSRGRRFGVVALDPLGRPVSNARLTVPEGFLAAHPCRRLVGAALQVSDEWVGRLLVCDPGFGVHREQSARFALQLAQQIAPAMYDYYLVQRLRTRAQMLERRRIARELHDGVTQSLLGLEMEIVVLRRRVLAEAPQLAEDLARVHGIVRDEVVAVRELMEGIRVDDVETGDLLHHLSDVVDRFSRYTGIAARFVSDGRPVPLTPHARRQMARIVHEALVNIRKHSGADRVLVRASLEDGHWKLSIEDDGRRFSFAGRRSQEELEAERQGPRTIGERARIVGGTISVESRPGFGARVEVSVPIEQAAISQ